MSTGKIKPLTDYSGEPLNGEFCRLLSKSGWSQSRAAKALALTPSAVNQIVQGGVRATQRNVTALAGAIRADLETILGPDAPRGLTASEVEMLKELRRLPQALREDAALKIKGFLTLLPSSAKDAGAEEALDASEQVADQELKESERSRAVRAPNAPKPAPPPGASPESKERPASPKRVPK